MIEIVTLVLAMFAGITSEPAYPAVWWDALPAAESVFMPGTFIGREWACGDENCYAGVVWIAGAPDLETGP